MANVTIQLRRGSEEGWMENDPILAIGEPGYHKDTKGLKIGDGIHKWSELPYQSAEGEVPIDAVLYTAQELSDSEQNQARENIGIVPSDWNQNDENANDYIKNRTHGIMPNKNYFEITQEMIENPLETNTDLGLIKVSDKVVHPSPEELIGTAITTKNEANEETVITVDESQVGDGSTIEDLGCPPLIFIENMDLCMLCLVYEELEFPVDETTFTTISPGIWFVSYDNTIAITNIKPLSIPKEIVYKLDEKYLSSNIQSDWNQNDVNAINYVKNRTHYTEPNKNYFNITQEMIENPLETIPNFSEGTEIHKISDIVLNNPSVEDIVGTIVTINTGTMEGAMDGATLEQVSDGRPDLPVILISFNGDILIFFVLEDCEIPTDTSSIGLTAGIWLFNTISDYNVTNIQSGNPEEIIYVLDEKYLPDSIVGKKVEGQSFTIDGETVIAQEGAEIFNDYANNVAAGKYSHAEGFATKALGNYSHAEGIHTTASGTSSHAEGRDTIANGDFQHAQGKYNIADDISAFIIGNGENIQNRSNAMTVDWEGNANIAGEFTSATGADYAEYFEWLDGNPNNEDRVGYLVSLNDDKIELATEDSDILGIVSGTAAIIGDVATWDWQGKYMTDEFGRVIWDMVEEFIEVSETVEVETVDENGETITKLETVTKTISAGFFPHRKLNPNYNPDKTYVPRSERPEWDTVGLMGKLHVRDDGTCIAGGYAKVGVPGIATYSSEKTNMRVMKRINDNIILVFMK